MARAGPRILEVDVGQHGAQDARERHGHDILRRDHVRRHRDGRQRPAHDGADGNVGGKIGHASYLLARAQAERGDTER